MINNEEEINKKIDMFKKKIGKKIFTISALKRINLKNLIKNLFSHVY